MGAIVKYYDVVAASSSSSFPLALFSERCLVAKKWRENGRKSRKKEGLNVWPSVGISTGFRALSSSADKLDTQESHTQLILIGHALAMLSGTSLEEYNTSRFSSSSSSVCVENEIIQTHLVF